MKQKMVTIPFDLETAKRIREGKISGQIVTEKTEIEQKSYMKMIPAIHSLYWL